jgi:hypothetical protein
MHLPDYQDATCRSTAFRSEPFPLSSNHYLFP